MNSDILNTLKNTTGPLHKRLEKSMNILAPNFSTTDYLQLIKGFWGYYLPFEANLTSVAELQVCLPDIAMRSKLPGLETDLKALGLNSVTLDALPVCSALPTCTDLSTALGCLYVIEGSTLGGQILSRHFNALLNLDVENGAAFFTGYGVQTGAMWQTFREALMVAPVNEVALINAACETFITLERWLCPDIIMTEK